MAECSTRSVVDGKSKDEVIDYGSHCVEVKSSTSMNSNKVEEGNVLIKKMGLDDTC